MSGETLNKQQRLVLTRLSWVIDANAYEVAKSLQFTVQQNVVARRLDDLLDMGLAERTGFQRAGGSNRQIDVWRCTDRGFEWLRLSVSESGDT